MTDPRHGLPSPEQVLELLSAEFARSGFDIEDVAVNARTRPPSIRVTVDSDNPLDLDTVAELSRSASDLLDGLDSGDSAYVLEVTSPGVDRPLTAEKHFRRARGRKVQMRLADGTTVTGRIGALNDGAIGMVVRDGADWKVRHIPLRDITQAVVQVEFSPPAAAELELALQLAESTEAQS